MDRVVLGSACSMESAFGVGVSFSLLYIILFTYSIVGFCPFASFSGFSGDPGVRIVLGLLSA